MSQGVAVCSQLGALGKRGGGGRTTGPLRTEKTPQTPEANPAVSRCAHLVYPTSIPTCWNASGTAAPHRAAAWLLLGGEG